MKKILLIILTSIAVAIATAACSSLKLTPEQKAEKAARDSAEHVMALTLLEGRQFMLKADRVHFGSGNVAQVTPNTNFFMMRGDYAMLQIAPKVGGGINGVGGVTFEGTVSNYKSTTDKKGETFITFNLSKGGLRANISITLPASNGYASLRAQMDTRRYNATINGYIEPYDPSTVVDGVTL